MTPPLYARVSSNYVDRFLSLLGNIMQVLKFVLATAAAALIAVPAIAQNVGDTAATAPSTASSKKVVRAQNRQIEKTVRRALTKTKGLDSSGVTILVKKNVVTLNGTVADESQIALAESVARGAANSSTVSNKLTIREIGN
jgi:hyperosmotically inducible periplasmic protein